MAKVSLLLLMVSMTVALALAHDTGNYTLNKREKRELLARSKRRWVLSTIELVEEDPGPFPKFATQMFNDRTELFKSHQFRLSGMGVTEEPLGVFSIGDNDGVVYVLKPIDRETHPFFHIMFDIIDKVTNRPVDKTLAFDVAITDINDNAPYFEHPVIEASVKESTPEGYLPVPLTARDMDQVNTQNSNISISVLSQEPAEPKINLKEVEGTKMSQLTFTGCFDYDKAKMYKVVVEARDHGIPALSSTVVVNLQITDSNTHQPVFKNKTYNAHMMEMESNKEILRVAVTDADTPNTTAWRAVYSIVKGNEEGNYKIETDPKTNEGILTVIKGKNIKEKTTLTNVQIAVANEEPLFVCSSGGAVSTAKPLTVPPQTVNVTVKVIDVNDPPMFDRKVTDVYAKEEQEEKGKVLYKPKITDVDSDVEKIRYELVDDPAGWVTIDPKTGVVTTVKKMDRESPHVNKDNIYTVLIQAIDNGEPPATATGTILVHLGDINDNTPYVVEKKLVMCGNKVIVPLADKDIPPFGCPCYLSLGADHGDKALKSRWKLDPANGMEAGLVSLKSLPYGNYTVPLVIQDQQGLVVNETVQVMVCDCEGGDKCRASLPRTSSLGLAAIGLLLAGLLLLFLLLLFLLLCECGGKTFTHLPLNLQDEGNQTLIKYNEEGGSSACKSEPMLSMTRTISNRVAVDLVDGVKQATPGKKFTQETNEMTQKTNEMHRTTGRTMVNQVSSSGGGGFSGWGTLSEANGTLRSQNGRGMQYQKWTTSRNNTMRNNSSRYSRSFSLLSDQHISEHIDRRLYMIGDEMDYQSYEYGYEGRGSNCQSLDELSLSNLGDDLKFLEDLGSKFNTLGGICHEDMQKRNIRL